MEKLREKGEYDRIIERHMSRFWEAQVTPAANIGNTPAVGVGKGGSRPVQPEGPSTLASGVDPKLKSDPSKKAQR
jgi:hypothetical protein